jgi:hypothetical protein
VLRDGVLHRAFELCAFAGRMFGVNLLSALGAASGFDDRAEPVQSPGRLDGLVLRNIRCLLGLNFPVAT